MPRLQNTDSRLAYAKRGELSVNQMETPNSIGSIEGVDNLLRTSRVGHIATISPKGRVSTVPIAYHFDGQNVFFGTPRDSSKLKFLQENPNVAFQLDNGKVMGEAVGVMMQGNAEIYETRDLLKKYKETMPAILRYSKKYPDAFVFYIRNPKKLAEVRRYTKYRVVRIVPDRILYWSGYDWGRVIPDPEEYTRFFDIHQDTDAKAMAQEVGSLFASMDTISSEQGPGEDILDQSRQLCHPKVIDQDKLMSDLFAEAMTDQKVTEDEIEILNTIRRNYRFYLDSLKNAMSDGIISSDECALLNTIKQSVYQSALDTALKDGEIKEEEANLLKKFRQLLDVQETQEGSMPH
jgi:nitroimidazol reductase NimA-like FMN-containing flavoprotein (pyridoxamine 5'-phosphate oxidase superfamily)